MVSSISIPKNLENLLKENQELHGGVSTTLARFGEILCKGEMTFFPEYTDHSSTHVQEVLDSIESLIPDVVWEDSLLNPEDAAAIVLAALVHDSAMKLTEDGFVMIRDGQWQAEPDKRFGDKPWTDLWEEFIKEARHFDGWKNKQLFGSQEPVSCPPDSPKDWTTRDRLLIGEFLRRHHARLAHEIAANGFPGPGGNLFFNEAISKEMKDASGIIARSHGMDLRSCMGACIKRNQPKTRLHGVYLPYLMVLMRIGDYIQIHSDRASKIMLNLHKLQSPVSRIEWAKHFGVKEITAEHDDKESLYVDAAPSTSHIFCKLKDLFRDIQNEMDLSWAVLGETYGRHEKLKQLGIQYRRLRSNLDDVNEFAQEVDYIPRHLCLRTKGADLLKLLVGPLYDERPEYGIRELLQNSVDAVREREDYLKHHSKPPHFEQYQQEADVVLSIEENKDGKGGVFTITDNGIGMTIETVNDYFLTAGASFRQSDTWKQQHTDEDGSRVLRSGRFGIGILAAFLLGDKVSVKTRHVCEEEGLEFSFAIEDQHIEAKKKVLPIGTSISIQIDENVFSPLLRGRFFLYKDEEEVIPFTERADIYEWDWYAYPSPTITYRYPDGSHRNSDNNRRILSNSKYDRLNTIHHQGNTSIKWTWHYKHDLCNGFQIRDFDYGSSSDTLSPGGEHSQTIYRPTLIINDPDAQIPLNLQRTEILYHKCPFKDELLKDVCKDFLAYSLVFSPEIPPWHDGFAGHDSLDRYPAFNDRNKHLFSYSQNGTLFVDRWFIVENKIDTMLVIPDDGVSVDYLKRTNVGKNLSIILNSSFDDYWENLRYQKQIDQLGEWATHITEHGNEKTYASLPCYKLAESFLLVNPRIDMWDLTESEHNIDAHVDCIIDDMNTYKHSCPR